MKGILTRTDNQNMLLLLPYTTTQSLNFLNLPQRHSATFLLIVKHVRLPITLSNAPNVLRKFIFEFDMALAAWKCRVKNYNSVHNILNDAFANIILYIPLFFSPFLYILFKMFCLSF